MNGKKNRVSGCWARGNTSYRPNSLHANTIPPLYQLPIIKGTLHNILNLNKEQYDLINFFETYPYVSKIELFNFNKNTPYSIVYLYQRDFKNGTVRITKPGIYILKENIVFNPNEDFDFLPTKEQSGINGIYPQNMSGPYHLGFFSAITIETPDVILDLNGKTLSQSKNHNFQQRFYANIELANMPFIPNQGPGDFKGAMTYKSGNRLLIQNGNLGLSSHHGIHGNLSNNTIIRNLHISNFEVAGIALNGTTNGIISDVKVINAKQDVPVLSTYSSARFIRKFLEANKDSSVTFNGKTVSNILNSINNDLNNTFTAFKTNNPLPDNYLKNPNIGYDGNIYGIVLNIKGVVVNGFINKRTAAMEGNEHIFLNNINISEIISNPVEIIGLSVPTPKSTAYGGKVQVGPVGDVLQIEKIQDTNGIYNGNNLSDGKMILAKIQNETYKKIGTTNITNKIISWVKDGSNINHIIENDPSLCYVGGGDSMNHIMKGNIGLFISGGRYIQGYNVNVSNVKTMGTNVGNTLLKHVKNHPNKDGSRAASLLQAGSENITFYNSNFGKTYSENGGEAVNNKVIP